MKNPENSRKNGRKSQIFCVESHGQVTAAAVWVHANLSACASPTCSVWPSGPFLSLCYIVSSRYASVAVFGLFLRPSSVLSLTGPSPQTRVTLLRQMAFCLAELHLWSTKSSLQVKGSTYHHVQSASLSLSQLFSLSLSVACSVIAHFVFTPCPHLTCADCNGLALSQCFHFLFVSAQSLFEQRHTTFSPLS